MKPQILALLQKKIAAELEALSTETNVMLMLGHNMAIASLHELKTEIEQMEE